MQRNGDAPAFTTVAERDFSRSLNFRFARCVAAYVENTAKGTRTYPYPEVVLILQCYFMQCKHLQFEF
jgi:hypothetical protein